MSRTLTAPSHGTVLDYRRGCKCRPCLDAWNVYCKARAPLHRERRALRGRVWRLANRDRVTGLERLRIRERLSELAEIKLATGCVDCGYRADPIALQFDHVRGEKCFALAASHKYPRDRVALELAKCEVVCANCHMIRTHARRRARS